MIHILVQKVKPEQIGEMLEVYSSMIKLAVDIRRNILAGGGEMHADCEKVLLDNGSEQDDVWGANWYPDEQEVEFEALINIRPRLANQGMVIQSEEISQASISGDFRIIRRRPVKNLERIRTRFMRDSIPMRLAGLAADLARISSSARRASGAAQVMEMIEESRYFIEWTAAEVHVEQAAELVDLQLMLTLWRDAWPEAQHSQEQRTLLSFQAKKWSDQVLGYSGLAKE